MQYYSVTNSLYQIHSSIYFRLKIVCQAEYTILHSRSVDTNLTEMSELFDKQVNGQKESLKKYRSSHKLPQAHKKVQ